MTMFMAMIIALSCKASILDERAQNLLQARDIKDLKIKIHLLSESRELAAKCGFELSNVLIPKSCYRLKLNASKKEVVDKACEKAANIMKEEVRATGLSKLCAQFINKKNKDIRYSKEESHPEELIQE